MFIPLKVHALLKPITLARLQLRLPNSNVLLVMTYIDAETGEQMYLK